MGGTYSARITIEPLRYLLCICQLTPTTTPYPPRALFTDCSLVCVMTKSCTRNTHVCIIGHSRSEYIYISFCEWMHATGAKCKHGVRWKKKEPTSALVESPHQKSVVGRETVATLLENQQRAMESESWGWNCSSFHIKVTPKLQCWPLFRARLTQTTRIFQQKTKTSRILWSRPCCNSQKL